MKALLQETTEGPEAVRVADVDTPMPNAGEVRVAIKAASINHREMWIARGLYPGMNLPGDAILWAACFSCGCLCPLP